MLRPTSSSFDGDGSSSSAGFEVPEDTQAGQVFLVNGEYYVAVPKGQPRALPPIEPALKGLTE